MAESVLPVEGVAYSANVFDDLFVALLCGVGYSPTTQAPLRTNPWGYNTLGVTGATSPVAVASGAAIVNGKLYRNTASVNVNIPTPASNPRIDRIVLRLDQTATPNTCTIQRLAGTEAASPSAPALTQTDGTRWEVSLAQVRITTGGAITLTDERAYVGDSGVVAAMLAALAVGSAAIANDAVTDAKLRNSAALSVIGRASNSAGDPADIAAASDGEVLRRSGTAVGFGTVATAGLGDNQVTDAKLRDSAALSVIGRSANSSGDPADIAAANDGEVLRRSGTVVGFGTVATAGLANLAVTLAKLAADAVDDTKAGDRVPQFYRRQGGHATQWGGSSGFGTTDYTPTAVRFQAGAALWSGSAAGSGSVTITFPVAFSDKPLVIVCAVSALVCAGVNPATQSASQATLLWQTVDASTTTSVGLYWLAIGPE
jgi:hypothetical protein